MKMFRNRLKEYSVFINDDNYKLVSGEKDKFYMELLDQINKLIDQIKAASSYGSFIVYEDKINKLQDEVTLLDNITVDDDHRDVFEGIKNILKVKLLECIQLLNKKKQIDLINLKEETYDPVIEEEEIKSHNKIDEMLLRDIEQENKKILLGQDYVETNTKIKQIDKIQRAINEHLLIQDERIDNVCNITKESSKIYKNISNMDFRKSGSFIRRFVTLLIICLTFVMIYMHFYYNRF
ncbi:hypothetical protein HERIO_1440 [Hepatospora eriocheir]|uniref:t-SNARE coiled-coil homology domain-containing protein n=1 Tax=Hepatospora eriocheir TaxID=1081669 RepID=A0A1X0QA12_9MICR|nr:hypothetical protein HERIO_1440 [Hepatospora eriocheir]